MRQVFDVVVLAVLNGDILLSVFVECQYSFSDKFVIWRIVADSVYEKNEITDPFTLGGNNEEKEGILDIKLILNQNRKINIEMQNTYQDDWTERSLFYNCRMFTDGFQKGHPYGELPPCIHVGILSFNQMISPNYYHKISLMDEKTKEIYSRKFQFHMIDC